jgi:multidrug transporter EmrE-like cation transporter
VLGLCNLAVCWSVLVGLSRVPGVVFFPAFSGGALALAALLGWTVWKERASPRAIAAVAVAVVAVVCANSGAA